jgi:uncharacterized DUF497 family protein
LRGDTALPYSEITFEWDAGKARRNLAKHGIPFAYATRAFSDPDAATFADRRRAYGEDRYNLVARVETYILCITFTLREGKIRIISARRASKKERGKYRPVQTKRT